MPPPELDQDPVHTKLLKSAVEFFANQVAHLFQMGRCGKCPKCTASVGNLGLYFTKCLARALDIPFQEQHGLMHVGPPPVPTPPSDPSDGNLN